MKKIFAIIGNPISHSLSPILHNYWFKKYSINAEYTLLDVKENELENITKKIRAKELDGINITLPYKQKIVPHIEIKKNGHAHLTQLNERALAILDERTKSAKDNPLFQFKNN